MICSKSIFQQTTAVILAGGNSSRMRCDKALLQIGNQTLIGYILNQLNPHFGEVLISAKDPCRYAYLDAAVVVDSTRKEGPIFGIASALKAAKNERVFITTCDTPMINLKLVESMLEVSSQYDCVVPTIKNDLCEPLFAVYQKSVFHVIQDMLLEGERSVIKLFSKLKVDYVRAEENDWFRNLNTIEDYLEFKREVDSKVSPAIT